MAWCYRARSGVSIAQFFHKKMRLTKVEYAPRAESGPTFNFYMGKNTNGLCSVIGLLLCLSRFSGSSQPLYCERLTGEGQG